MNVGALGMFVLDVMQDDIESLSSVLRVLNNPEIGWRAFWPHDFVADEVVPALLELCRDGMIKALVYDEEEGALVHAPPSGVNILDEAEDLWFLPTEKGRKAWEEWTPPVERDEADTGSGDGQGESSVQ